VGAPVRRRHVAAVADFERDLTPGVERHAFIGGDTTATMPELGKVDRDFFAERIRPHLGAERADVRLGPTHGVDFGVVDVDGTALVVATDPLSILPALGLERAGRFALDIVLADVAVSGIPPSHVALSFALPPELTDEEFATVWEAIDAEAADLGASVVTGHTARYSGVSFPWVGGATAMAVGDHADVVRPDGARPGDDLILTKGPAVESVGLLATLFPEAVDVDPDTLRTAQERLDEASAVRDALAAAAAGPVTALHDVTEGGVHGALNELAASAGVRLDVRREAVPIRPGVLEVCEALGFDPWTATTSGSLLAAVDPAGTDDVLAALDDRGTPAALVGRATEGSGVYVDDELVEPPEQDSSWAVYAALAGD
jgi:hydrogenase maturation factor